MKSTNFLYIFLLVLLVSGCEKYADDYKKYLDKKEITYPGLAQGVFHQSGNLRAVLHWNPSSDPNIHHYIVTWNNGTDSIRVDNPSTNPEDMISLNIEPLDEYVYTFKIIAFDTNENPSIGQYINNVRVYGPAFQSTLRNRTVVSAVKSSTDAEVELSASDPNSPYTQITYTNDQEESVTLRIEGDETRVTLPNYKSQSSFSIQSFFLPNAQAIDHFASKPESFRVEEDITSLYINNPGFPFYRADGGTGKWGLAKDWVTNDAARNQVDRNGGWSSDDQGVIHFETQDWGGEGVHNGKVHQQIELPEGNYALEIESGYYGGTFEAYHVIQLGDGLPDIESMDQALAFIKMDENTIQGKQTILFELKQTSKISLGWVVNIGQYTYLQFRGLRLRSLPVTE